MIWVTQLSWMPQMAGPWLGLDCEVVMCHDNMQDLDNVPAPSNKKGKKTGNGKGKKAAKKAAMLYKWASFQALQPAIFLMNCFQRCFGKSPRKNHDSGWACEAWRNPALAIPGTLKPFVCNENFLFHSMNLSSKTDTSHLTTVQVT